MVTGGGHGIMETRFLVHTLIHSYRDANAIMQAGLEVVSLLSRLSEGSYKFIIKLQLLCQDGRVGLRRQFQVLVRKGMGSNPILDRIFLFFVLNSVFCSLLFLFFVLNFCVLLFPK